MSNSSLVAPNTRSVLDALSSARWQARCRLRARERHLAIQKGEQCIMRTSAQLLSMKGRRVLVTGAAAGIGRAMALRFAEAGAELLLLDIDEAGLTQTAAEVSRLSSRVTTQVVDLAHKTQIDAFWSHFEVDLPDTLINNIGSCYLFSISAISYLVVSMASGETETLVMPHSISFFTSAGYWEAA